MNSQLMNKNIYKVAILGAMLLGFGARIYAAFNGPTQPSVVILADTNRDGVVDSNDATGKQAWTKTLGAIYTVNYDADGGLHYPAGSMDDDKKVPDSINFGDDGLVNFEDFQIESDPDKADIAPVKIKVADMPADLRVFLVVDEEVEMRAVHIFKKIKSKTEDALNTAIWGGGHETTNFPLPWTDGDTEVTDIEVTKWLNPNSVGYEETRNSTSDEYYEFGIEGLLLAGMDYFGGTTQRFDGKIHLKLELRESNGTTVCAEDHIVMRVAPWLTLHPERPSEEVWALDGGAANDALRNPQNAPPAPNQRYVGLAHSNQLSTDDNDADNSQWFQDHVEIGYTQRPQPAGVTTSRMHLVFRLPYSNGGAVNQPPWPVVKLLAPNFGIFQLGEDLGANSGDYGGNLETIVPSTSYPLGRIVMGDAPPSDRIKEFIDAQEFQVSSPPDDTTYSIDTNWLWVGHIDEVCAFLPNDRVIMASSRQAIGLLENNIAAGDRASRVFFGKHDPAVAGGLRTLVGTTTQNSTEIHKVHTGIPLAQAATYKYIRFIDGNNRGWVCEFTAGQNFVTVHAPMWCTGRDILDYCAITTRGFPNVPVAWALPQQGEEFVLVEDSQMHGVYGYPTVVTVKEILRKRPSGLDNLFVLWNRFTVQETLNEIQEQLQTANGMTVLTYTPIPVLYFGEIANGDYSERTWEAITPGAVNFQYVNGNLYAPRQFGPLDGTGTDFYETAIVNAVTQPVLFVDDLNLYHFLKGEVHCGSNVKHSFPVAGKEWWKFTP